MMKAHFSITLAILLATLYAAAPAVSQIEPRPPSFLPSARLAALYYDDTDDNRRMDQSAQVGVLLDSELEFDLHVLHHDTEARSGEEEAFQGWGFFSRKLTDSEFFSIGLGAIIYEDSQDALGSLKYFLREPEYFVLAEASHKALIDTRDIISNQITFYQALFEGDYALHHRVRPRMKAELNEYSDNNNEFRGKFDLPFRFLSDPFNAHVAYRIEYARFRRQSGGGYFDPTELVSHQAVLAFWHWSEQRWAFLEVATGRQKTERFDSNAEDDFVAIYGEAEFRVAEELSIGALIEGGDYSLASASGFRYTQAIIYLVWHLE